MTRGPMKPGVGGVLLLLAQLAGGAWFGFFVFIAVSFFIFRGFADEPGSLMTVPRALRVSATMVLIGSPGLLVAWIAARSRRRMREAQERTPGFEVLPPR